ncbi:hypothetical protein [Longispora albida]|uniref:hypothetical protein n=1 Tax=Longispora albida TaxID=203523 RepID=UPI00036EA8D5|nr:hypothetical protein [Longispora albida]
MTDVLTALAARVRRRGTGGGELLGPLDEIYRPAAYEIRIEAEARQEQGAPHARGGEDSGYRGMGFTVKGQ